MGIPLNQQPIEKPTRRHDGELAVHHMWLTIQGEGPFVGTPAVFVRLAGCNLACPACDTDYTSRRELLPVPEIVSRILSLWTTQRCVLPLVVLTGGEPFRQNITPLVNSLLACRIQVQVETNGTLFLPDLPYHDPRFMVVCSPKAGINPQLRERVGAWKYVVTDGEVDPIDGLPLSALGNTAQPGKPGPLNMAPIYIQPRDDADEEANKRHLQAALTSCFTFGYRLCLQTHKIIGLE